MQSVDFPADAIPRLIVVIDTEEQFNWDMPADRSQRRVDAMRHIERVQDIFDQYAVTPCYVVDYPILEHPDGWELLKNFFDRGRCEIGAHLHPWVNPPYTEEMHVANTYPGNLSVELESSKLLELTNRITAVFGKRPVVYKAGRYGIGPNTPKLLKEQGYCVDLSHCPPVDYRQDGGPDFRSAGVSPGWLDQERSLLEIPVTGAYVGWLGGLRAPVYELANQVKRLRLPGLLAKVSAVDRLMLSPEGFEAAEHRRLIAELMRRGVRTFTWSFHSPSVAPGYTPYVRDEKDLQRFLESFHRFFDLFFEQMRGLARTPVQIKSELEALT